MKSPSIYLSILALSFPFPILSRTFYKREWTPDLSGLDNSQLIKMINVGLARKQAKRSFEEQEREQQALEPEFKLAQRSLSNMKKLTGFHNMAQRSQSIGDMSPYESAANADYTYSPYGNYDPYETTSDSNAAMLNNMNMGLYRKRSGNRGFKSLRSYKVGPAYNGKAGFSLPFAVFKRNEVGGFEDEGEEEASAGM